MIDKARLCLKGVAYMHFHPEDKGRQKILDKLFKELWDLGYPKTAFYPPSRLTDELKVEEMTQWEIKYYLRKL